MSLGGEVGDGRHGHGAELGVGENLKVKFEVGVFPSRYEVPVRFFVRSESADEEAGAADGREGFFAAGVAGESGGEFPIGGDGPEVGEGVECDAISRE